MIPGSTGIESRRSRE